MVGYRDPGGLRGRQSLARQLGNSQMEQLHSKIMLSRERKIVVFPEYQVDDERTAVSGQEGKAQVKREDLSQSRHTFSA